MQAQEYEGDLLLVQLAQSQRITQEAVGIACEHTPVSRCSITTGFQPQTGEPPGTLRGTVGSHQPQSRDVGIYYPSERLDSSSRIRLNTSLYQYLSACPNTPHTSAFLRQIIPQRPRKYRANIGERVDGDGAAFTGSLYPYRHLGTLVRKSHYSHSQRNGPTAAVRWHVALHRRCEKVHRHILALTC